MAIYLTEQVTARPRLSFAGGGGDEDGNFTSLCFSGFNNLSSYVLVLRISREVDGTIRVSSIFVNLYASREKGLTTNSECG